MYTWSKIYCKNQVDKNSASTMHFGDARKWVVGGWIIFYEFRVNFRVFLDVSKWPSHMHNWLCSRSKVSLKSIERKWVHWCFKLMHLSHHSRFPHMCKKSHLNKSRKSQNCRLLLKKEAWNILTGMWSTIAIPFLSLITCLKDITLRVESYHSILK